jgi:hypothetical protein
MSYLCSQRKPNVQIMYFVFRWSIYCLFVLNTAWKRYSLQMYVVRKCFLDMKHGSTKNAFWDVNNKKWRIWCKFVSPFLFNNAYGLPVLIMDTKCPNEVFMFDWSIYRLFVLNRGWKLDSLQIMTFLCFPPWSIVELKTRFEKWITRNGVSIIYLVDMRHSRSKDVFWDWITIRKVNGDCFTFLV